MLTPERIKELSDRHLRVVGAGYVRPQDAEEFARAVLAHRGQPQAVAVPLTDEQRNAIYDKHCFLGDNGWEIDWWKVIDEVEAAHGIKGGQHGAS